VDTAGRVVEIMVEKWWKNDGKEVGCWRIREEPASVAVSEMDGEAKDLL
jgi:hypothetical protein